MAEKLTAEQREAVENRGGRLLVSAAAGSGKTKVLVDRLLGYLTDPVDPANIDDFLMITYTKAAAAELRGKIASKLSERVAQQPDNRHLQQQLQRLYLTKISTVHAFCGDILREYAYRLDIAGDFRVADENECREIREAVLGKLLEEAYAQGDDLFHRFVDSQGLGRDDRLIPEIIQKVYDSARCHLDPEAWLHHCEELVDTDGVTDAAQTSYGAYLIQRLQEWLDLQITAMEHCVALADGEESGQKVSQNLANILIDLRGLRQCRSWDEILAGKQVAFDRLVFPKTFDEETKARIKAIRDNCKKGLEKQTRGFENDSDRVLEDLASSADALRGLMAQVRAFGTAYTKAKQSRRILDFGDLEHKMLDLLLGKSRGGITAVAHEIGSRFREVMVDEYQDSNAVQDAIYGALTAKKQNLFLVGDVKQSIYQFRLADPGIFLEKYMEFMPAERAGTGQDRKVLLSRNFRSSAGVLSGCNDVFRLCMCPQVGGLYYGDAEALYEGIPHTPLEEPETTLYCIDVQQETYPEEAAFVADHIRQLLDGNHYVRQGDALRPICPEDIAILLRSPGSAGAYFQQALERCGIRYASGGGADLLQAAEIATLHSLLQAIHNPRLDIPLLAAMASPLFGFTANELAQIRAGNKDCCFYESVGQRDDPKCRAFLETIQRLRQVQRVHSLTGLLEEIFISTGMLDIYGAMDGGTLRRGNLESFYQLAADFEAGGNRDLGRFLEHLDAMQAQGLITAGDQSAAGCVTIMSIHKSKGLEFPVVVLCGLGREFNTESQRSAVLCHKEMGLGLAAVDTKNRLRYPTIAKRAISAKIGAESVSEELRVLYVAMTRARDRLIMTYASNRLQQDISQIVQQMDAGGTQLLIREAVCPGDWVLLTALHRTEAGELFALGGKPSNTSVQTIPWQIRVVQAPSLTATDQPEQGAQQQLPAEALRQIADGLGFTYAYGAATTMPGKQTATQRKGRIKDAEAAENTEVPVVPQRTWRAASFAGDQPTGKEFGNAIHAFMQYVDYAACRDIEGVRSQIQHLVQQQYISQEQGSWIRPGKIAAFFATPLGRKLQTGNTVREFKFSILEDVEACDGMPSGEQILLQGVVDCALIEDDGITVIDFKTDYLTEETMADIVAKYSPQVRTYAQAMARIYQKPVKQALLYFFHTDSFVAVSQE